MKIKKEDIFKYISFAGAVVGVTLFYLFNEDYSFAQMGAGWLEMGIIIHLIVGLIICAGLANGVKHFNFDGKIDSKEKTFIKSLFHSMFIKYFLWGVAQQGFIFAVFGGLYLLIGSWSILLSAFLFALLHFPNYILMLAVFGLNQMFFHFFLETGNIIPCLYGHGLIASVLMYYIPNPIRTDWVTWGAFWKKQRALNKAFK